MPRWEYPRRNEPATALASEKNSVHLQRATAHMGDISGVPYKGQLVQLKAFADGQVFDKINRLSTDTEVV